MSAFIPALIAGVGALGGLLGNRPKTYQQQQQQGFNQFGNQYQGFSGTGTQTPAYDPLGENLRQALAQMYLGRAGSVPEFMRNYEATGLEGINKGAESNRAALNQILAARGLSYSPAAATALGGLESNRIGQGVAFRNQLPLVQDQLQQQRLADLSGFFSRLPYGTSTTQTGTSTGTSSTTGSSSGTGTSTDPGNMLGGLTGGLGNLLAFLYGQGAFGGGGYTRSGARTNPFMP